MKKIVSILLAAVLAISTIAPAASAFASDATTNATSFISDFTSTDDWSGDTAQINTANSRFDRGSNKKITSVNQYDFGEKFNAGFDITYSIKNGGTQDATTNIYQTGKDVVISIGKFEIQIKNWQSEIVVLYDGVDIGGTSVRNFTGYPRYATFSYDIHIEKGNISIDSYLQSFNANYPGDYEVGRKMVAYTSTYSDFEAVNDATVSLLWNGWNITSSGSYIKNFGVQAEVSNEQTNATSFTSDFTSTDDWSGDTAQINTANSRFDRGSNKKITSVNQYDFGEKFNAGFDITYSIKNGGTQDATTNIYQTGKDVVISIGKFEIQIKNWQSEIVVLYDGVDIGGTSVCNFTGYPRYATFSYDIHIEKGNISIDSYLQSFNANYPGDYEVGRKMVAYTSTYSDFEAVNDATVSLLWNGWNITSSGSYIKNFGVQAEVSNEQTDATSFTSDFTSTDDWSGDTTQINTANSRFDRGSNKKITSVNQYDFGEKFNAGLDITYSIKNGGTQDATTNIYQTGKDVVVSIGKFEIQIKNWQSEIVVLYDGVDIGGTSVCNFTGYPRYATFSYDIHIEKGNISIDSYLQSFNANYPGDYEVGRKMVAYTSTYSDFEAVNDATVSLLWSGWNITSSGSYIKNLDIQAEVSNEQTNATSFTSDFTTTDEWSGDTTQIDVTQGHFAKGAGKKVTSVNQYNFSEAFEASFALTYSIKNIADKDETTGIWQTGRDFVISIGKFDIEIYHWQSEIKVLYDGQDIGGTSKCNFSGYPTYITYTYDIHIEKGDISITSYDASNNKMVEYTSTFSDFEAVNNANVSLAWYGWGTTGNGTYVKSLGVQQGISDDGPDETPDDNTPGDNTPDDTPDDTPNATSFTPDFKTTEDWSEDTDKINTDKGRFDRGSNKKIVSVNKYDFGNLFEANFDLTYSIKNGGTQDATTGIWKTGKDVVISIGKFEIQICDWQSKIVVLYDGVDIGGTSQHYISSYEKYCTYTYEVHIEPGDISIASYDPSGNKKVAYTSTFSGFEAVNDANITLLWNGYNVTSTDSYLKNFSVQAVTPDDTPSGTTNATSFTPNFSTTEGWSGDTDKINTDKKRFESKDQAGIASVNKYDFGTKFEAGFELSYEIANAAACPKDDKGIPQTGNEVIITIGKFVIQIWNNQSKIVVLYEGVDIGGTSTSYITEYEKYATYTYKAHIEQGNIKIDSYNLTTGDKKVAYTSTFSDFDAVNDAQVEIKWNESWQQQGTPSIRNFSVQVATQKETPDDTPSGTNSTSFTPDFSTTEGWSGNTDKINTDKKRFESKDQAGITSVNKYDFGTKFEAGFDLSYEIVNQACPKDDKGIPQTGNEVIITIGKFVIQIWNNQSKIVVLYEGVDIGGTSTSYITEYEKYASYTYEVYIEPGNISIASYGDTGIKIEYTSTFSGFSAVNNAQVAIKWNESWQQQGTPCMKNFFVQQVVPNTTKNAKGLSENFKTKDNWKGDTYYIFTDKRGFGSKSEKGEGGATITSIDKYDFGEKFDASFTLNYGAANVGHYKPLGEKPPYPTGKDYSIKIGKFEIQFWNYQSEIKILYKGKDIGGKSECYHESYSGMTLYYKVHIERGNITIVGQNEMEQVKVKYTSKFADFEAVNNASVTLNRKETWQIVGSYIKKLIIGTPPSATKYKSLYTFNAVDDFTNALKAEDPATAMIKSQWNVFQKNTGMEWTTDEIKAKDHISGFYSKMPVEPSPIPVIQTLTGSSASEVGVYYGNLLLRANYTTAQKQTTALSFEAPAKGQIRLYDPEEGMLAVASSLNGQATFCLNDDNRSLKCCYVTIYKNDEKIWPQDKDAFTFANSSHPDLTSGVTDTEFPNLLVDVEQGDMIYIAVTPAHYGLGTQQWSAQNPTVVKMNPQVDYVSVQGEMKLNTDRELTDGDEEEMVSSRITKKSTAIKALLYNENTDSRITVIFAGVASAVFVVFMSIVTVVYIKRKRRTAK